MFFKIDEIRDVLEECINDEREDIMYIPAVRTIGKNVTHGDKYIREIVIPDGVEIIRDYAFWYCPNLETVRFLGNSIKRIDAFAFSHCPSLRNIGFPESVEYVDPQALYDTVWTNEHNTGMIVVNGYLYKYYDDEPVVDIPEGIRIIGTEVFEGKKLETVHFPSSLRMIHSLAFHNCKMLKSVILPEGLEIVAPYVFMGCESIESIVIPSTIKRIGISAFTNVQEDVRCEIDVSDGNMLREWFSFNDIITAQNGRNNLLLYVPYIAVEDIEKDVLISACIGFMEKYVNGKTANEICRQYNDMIMENRFIIYHSIERFPFILTYMCSEKLIPSQDIEYLLDIIKGDVEQTALLLAYSEGQNRTDYDI